MSDLVFIRLKETEDAPAGHAIGVDEATADSLLVDPIYEKCKSGDGWKVSKKAAAKPSDDAKQEPKKAPAKKAAAKPSDD